MPLYQTTFNLTEAVNDFETAAIYLAQSNMLQHVDSNEISDKIYRVDWILDNSYQGHIEIETADYLSDEEKQQVSKWISWCHIQDLGEAFEKQDFANSFADDEADSDNEDDYWNEDFWTTSSFDWRTNEYPLFLVQD